jgi:hypothetical protein
LSVRLTSFVRKACGNVATSLCWYFCKINQEQVMAAIDRRRLLRDILPGAVAVAAVATVGLTLIPQAAEALPLANDKAPALRDRDIAEKAQVVVVGPRRRGWRRRRWVCWWRRGRRVCGWRYW